MPLYMIEREIPNAKNLTKDELKGIAQKSMCALEHIPGYRWDRSYVAGDKFYCVHEAKDEASVREHSRRGGFPVLSVLEVAAVVSPATAGETAREKTAGAA